MPLPAPCNYSIRVKIGRRHETSGNHLSEDDKRKMKAAKIKEQVEAGIPRMHILKSLWRMSLDGMSVSQGEEISQIKDSIEGTMVGRNIDGKTLEKEGRTDEAMALYEENIKDCFDGSWPYDRLAKIYAQRKDYSNAIRVYETYLNNTSPAQREKEYSRIMQHINEWKHLC